MSAHGDEVRTKNFSRVPKRLSSDLEIAEAYDRNGMHYEQARLKFCLLLAALRGVFLVPTRFGTVTRGDRCRRRVPGLCFELCPRAPLYRRHLDSSAVNGRLAWLSIQPPELRDHFRRQPDTICVWGVGGSRSQSSGT